MATMEKVETVGNDCATAAPLATKTKINNSKYFFIKPLHFVPMWQKMARPALSLSVLVLLLLRSFLAIFAVKLTPVCPAHTQAPQSPALQTTPEHIGNRARAELAGRL